ncbi:MAG: histidinol-phosphate transaminase [Verrucomicrobiota bacterium]
MNEDDLLHPSIAACPIYEPGLPIEEVVLRKGLDPSKIVKLASNENPLGPSPLAIERLKGSLRGLHLYPDGGAFSLREKLAEKFNLDPNQILAGNGSNEILEMIATAYLQPGENAVMGQYGFVVYRLATLHAKAEARAVQMPNLVHDLDRFANNIDERTKVVFLANPNNPTGDLVPRRQVMDFVEGLPEHVLFCYDEAYVEYLEDPVDFRPLIREGRRIICVRTFSKIHGLAGLRIGFAYSTPSIVASLQRVRQPFNVGSGAQQAAIGALDDYEHQSRTRQLNLESLDYFEGKMREIGCTFRRSDANFVLVKVDSARECFEDFLDEGVIVRPLDGYGLGDYIRVSTGTMMENRRFLEVLTSWVRNQR